MDVDMNSVTGIPVLTNYFNGISINPLLLIIVVIVIILYVILFGSLGLMNQDVETSHTKEMKVLSIILVALFIVLVIINGLNHFFNIDVITTIKNFFSTTPEIDVKVNNMNESNEEPVSVPEIKLYKEVYHIPGNYYNYPNAKAVCNAFGGRLASYKEIEKAYNEGGEWCSYGWSKDQMALFPTQYKTWKKYQTVKGHKNDCGRPGINGGFIMNPRLRFGVNCYGHKPKITQYEAELMEKNKEYPVTRRSLAYEKRVDYWKSKINDILVAPFNRNSWSRI